MSILKKVGLFFFSFFLLVFCFLLTLSFLLRVNIRESSISKYVQENDFTFLLKKSNGEDSKLLKETKTFLEELGISPSVIDSILESEVSKKYMSDYAVKYILYYLGEGSKPEFNASLFKKVLRENQQIVSWMFKSETLQVREQKQKQIEKKIDLYASDVLNFFPTVQNFMRRVESEKTYLGLSMQELLNICSLLMSKKWIFIIIALIWMSLIFIFLCGKDLKHVYQALFVSSFIYVFILIIIEILLGTVFKATLMNRLEVASVFINYMVNVLSKDIWVFVIVGIITCIFFYKYPKWVNRTKSLTST